MTMEQVQTFPEWIKFVEEHQKKFPPAAVRDTVIRSVVHEQYRGEIHNVLLSVELGLMTTEKGGTMKVTREGTAVIELYLRYLEFRIADLMKLEVKTDEQIDGTMVEIPCGTCNGTRYLTESAKGKKGKLYKKCPVCKGMGFNTIKQAKE
jgi:hypothetical protein